MSTALRGAQRIAAGVAGVAVFVGAGVVTLGLAAVATVGILVACAVARRKGWRFTLGTSWLVGAGAVAVVSLIGAVVLLTQFLPDTVDRIQRTTDSIAAAPPPPPEWLRRITPPAAQRRDPTIERIMRSRAMTVWSTITGVVLSIALLSGVIGSLGWAASLLLLYAITGDWLRRAAPDPAR